MRSASELAEDLAEAARPSFTAVSRESVGSALAASEYGCAIYDSLWAASEAKYPLPADLVADVRRVTAGPDWDEDREEYEALLELIPTV